MDRFYISYIDDKNTEYYCVEEVSALKATERFFDFCDKNNIDPKSFRITGMIKGPDEQLAASEAAGADELEDAEREKPASGNTQQVLEELRQRAINAIKNTRHEDIKNAETRKEKEERAIEYCESLMQYAEQDKASYFFRAERNLLILLTLFSSVEKDEDEEVSNSIVYMLTNFNDTIHRILKHMVKHPEDASLLKKYTSALDLSGKSKEIAAALLTEINVIDKIVANE